MIMPPQLALFATAALAPVPLIAAAAVWGGVWVVAAVVWLTLVAAVIDAAARRVTPATDGDEFPATAALTATLVAAQIGLLALAVWALTGGWLSVWEKAGVFVATGLFAGQIGNANAHEAIHRPARWLRRLGEAAYASVLFGHHASAHPLVHHVHVATKGDPSSARLGEGFWRFAVRAWIGSFRAGFRAESARLRRIGRARWRHPYARYGAMSAAAGIVAWAIGGGAGLLVWVGLAVFAQVQLLLSDYVQHYGLSRSVVDGRAEPVGMRHSWNAGGLWSSAAMLNAPRHSDHHTHPARGFAALELPARGQAPTLPRSLPVMACVALWPRAWRRVMDPRGRIWRNGARATTGDWTGPAASGSMEA